MYNQQKNPQKNSLFQGCIGLYMLPPTFMLTLQSTPYQVQKIYTCTSVTGASVSSLSFDSPEPLKSHFRFSS